nr:hypothetical protein [uncultured Carboxylicivirga sp.]
MDAKQTKSTRLIVALVAMMVHGLVLVNAQSQDNHLACLKKEYAQNDAKVLLDCKPDDAQYLSYDIVEWAVFKIKSNGQYGNELSNAISTRGSKFYLHPQEIFKSVGEDEVAVRFYMHNGKGKGYQVYYKIKVRAKN